MDHTSARYAGFSPVTQGLSDDGAPTIRRPVVTGPGTLAPIPRPDEPLPPWRSGLRSPFTDLLPVFRPVHGWFQSIAVAAPQIATGQSAWYGLQSVAVTLDNDQELQLNGVEAEVLPCDVDGAGGATSPIAWGTSAGIGAALVVGIDLPVQFGAWTSAPSMVPGVETTGDYANTPAARGSGVLWYTSLPTGKYTDTVPNKWKTVKSWGAFTARVTQGRRLDIALVVRRSAIHNITGNLYGYGAVTVTAGQVEGQAAFSN